MTIARSQRRKGPNAGWRKSCGDWLWHGESTQSYSWKQHCDSCEIHVIEMFLLRHSASFLRLWWTWPGGRLGPSTAQTGMRNPHWSELIRIVDIDHLSWHLTYFELIWSWFVKIFEALSMLSSFLPFFHVFSVQVKMFQPTCIDYSLRRNLACQIGSKDVPPTNPTNPEGGCGWCWSFGFYHLHRYHHWKPGAISNQWWLDFLQVGFASGFSNRDLNLRYLSRASLDATTATTCAAPATGGSLDRLGGKDFQDSR